MQDAPYMAQHIMFEDLLMEPGIVSMKYTMVGFCVYLPLWTRQALIIPEALEYLVVFIIQKPLKKSQSVMLE